MGLKIFLISIKIVIVTSIFGLVFSGCTPAVMQPSPTDVYRQTPREADEFEKNAEKSGLSPRALAALQLTEQGRMFLENNQPDDAIGILERALNLNPDNGRNYYYLAEAWLMKWNIGPRNLIAWRKFILKTTVNGYIVSNCKGNGLKN